MEERTEKLIKFIETYGEDFLSDGTTGEIIGDLKRDKKSVFEKLVKTLDSEWMERVAEVGGFRTFTDSISPLKIGSEKTKFEEYYTIGYMDDFVSGATRIPVLKHMVPKYIDKNLLDKMKADKFGER